jgi:hypothetical protein
MTVSLRRPGGEPEDARVLRDPLQKALARRAIRDPLRRGEEVRAPPPRARRAPAAARQPEGLVHRERFFGRVGGLGHAPGCCRSS